MGILRLLDNFHQEEDNLQWTGSFEQYLEMVKANPIIAQTAHSRIYNMIINSGIEEENGVKKYKFFSDSMFGLDDAIERLVEDYFHSAARRLDVRKRVLLLMGPVSGGKSTIVHLLKKGMERFSRTDEGAVYAIKGCPMHEDPLHLIPDRLRPHFEEEYGIRIEGSLCPICRLRLREEWKGEIRKVPVTRILFSEDDRVGIGTFSPSDPKSQDISELTGSIDFSTISEYGSESDPRAYRFDGELNKANRGLMEFQEMLKSDEKFLWNLLSLTQEGNFKAGRFALISADELIVAHTNETEYKSFIHNKRNEALHSRIIVMPIPYNLKVSEEVRILEKLVNQGDLKQVHIAPHALKAAAMFSILTRLKPSKNQNLDLVTKMKLYDGEQIENFTTADVREMKNEYPDEGMSGIDPRYIINRLSSALIKHEMSCINPLTILRSIKDGLDTHPGISLEEQEHYLHLIGIARQEYDEIAKREVQKTLIHSFEESAQTLLNHYLDHVEAYCHGKPLQDPITDEQIEADEKLMRSIEEQIGVSENAKRAFREEILIRLSTFARKGKQFEYHSHDKLREAIEKKLFVDLKDLVKITAVKAIDQQQLKKVNDVTARLMDDLGYCPHCAYELLKYTGSLLNR